MISKGVILIALAGKHLKVCFQCAVTYLQGTDLQDVMGKILPTVPTNLDI